MATTETVTVRQGRLRGLRRDGHVVWRGIPYAQAPVGALRWRAPRQAPPWDGVREADAYGAPCLQPPMFAGAGDGPLPASGEDCLYLNVCAPSGPVPDGGWPVLFWIHGGGYVQGSGDRMGDGEAFADAGIMVVTINYRLGALGFTHLAGVFGEAESDAGVCGMLDQIAALRWVRENIAAFGGDPARVTVYGVSAGAKSVAGLMASPLARGMFAQAVSSSGGADHVASAEAGTALARRLMDELGCKDAAEARAVPAEEVLAAQERIPAGRFAVWLWRPTVHPAVLPAVPLELIARGSATGVRLLIGNNAEEATTFALMLGAEAVTEPAPEVLGGILGEEGYRRLLATYRGERGLPDDRAAMVAAMSDERYGIPTLRLADAQACHGQVYRYRVDVAAPGYPARMDGGHGTESAMAWRTAPEVPGPAALGKRVSPARLRAAESIHRAWVGFVRDGVPGGEGLPEWPVYDTERRAVLVFDEDTRVVDDPRRAERLVWGDVVWPSGTWFPILGRGEH